MKEYSENNSPIKNKSFGRCPFCGSTSGFHLHTCVKLIGSKSQQKTDRYVIYSEYQEAGFFGFLSDKRYSFAEAQAASNELYRTQREPLEHWVLHESLFIESKPSVMVQKDKRAEAQGVTTMKRPYKKSKSLTLSKVYRPWEEYAESDSVVGKVVGFHKDNYDKKSVVVEVEEAIFSDKKKAKEITGKNLVLNSCGQLEKQIENDEIQIGHILEVIYKGKSTIEKGKYKGKEAHVLEINLLEEDDGTGDDSSGDDSEDEGL